jgi:putative DNA primase/helicase
MPYNPPSSNYNIPAAPLPEPLPFKRPIHAQAPGPAQVNAWAVLEGLPGFKHKGSGYEARCPAHKDDHASLSLTRASDGTVLLYCHALCSLDAVLDAVGLHRRDLFPRHDSSIAQLYDYRDEQGCLLYQVVRKLKGNGGKDFFQRRPNGAGGWIWKLGDTRRVPYRLPELVAADPGEIVLIPEGEKDVDRLYSLGFTATTNSEGAGKWRVEFNQHLKGRSVVILPDNDEPGRNHADLVAASLKGVAASVAILMLPDLPDKGDVSDWLNKGHTPGELRDFIKAVPLPDPQPQPEQPQPQPQQAASLFRTARQVAEATPEVAEWVVQPWVAKGSITELDGKIKYGKTTAAMAMCKAAVTGTPFLGVPTGKTKVVYLTEQPSRSFREALRRAGLLDSDDLHCLFWHDTRHLNWKQIVGMAALYAGDIGANLLVVDTLAWWAGLRGEAENSTGEAQEAMAALAEAAGQRELGVLVLRHDRKSGGEVGDSGRGASAFGGSVDVILDLKRPEGNTNPKLRVIHSLSRFDETPDKLVIELTDEGYTAKGFAQAVAQDKARRTVLSALKNAGDDGLTLDDMAAETETARSTMQRAVDELINEKLVTRWGEGIRGDPYRYQLIPLDGFCPPAHL